MLLISFSVRILNFMVASMMTVSLTTHPKKIRKMFMTPRDQHHQERNHSKNNKTRSTHQVNNYSEWKQIVLTNHNPNQTIKKWICRMQAHHLGGNQLLSLPEAEGAPPLNIINNSPTSTETDSSLENPYRRSA
jgi:hypothetical protein